MSYDYNTFKELFDHHIQYSYEPQYGVVFSKGVLNSIRIEYITFYKLTIFSNGELEYKGNVETYDPRLWDKVKLLAEMLQETTAEKILYKPENKKSP